MAGKDDCSRCRSTLCVSFRFRRGIRHYVQASSSSRDVVEVVSPVWPPFINALQNPWLVPCRSNGSQVHWSLETFLLFFHETTVYVPKLADHSESLV